MKYSTVIVAAGRGSRMHLGYNKVYAPLSDGRTILQHTMDLFLADPDCAEIVVVTEVEQFAQMCGDSWPAHTVVVSGGESRQESVANGLSAVTEKMVLIHDGARPYLPSGCLAALKKAMEKEKAACLMVPCKDTISIVRGGFIAGTLERSELRAAQTPQAFATDLILSCIHQAEQEGFSGTDDCSLVSRYSNVKIRAVEGSYANFKITTPEDLHQTGS